MNVRPDSYKCDLELDETQENSYQYCHYVNIIKCFVGYQNYALKNAVMDEKKVKETLQQNKFYCLEFTKNGTSIIVAYISDTVPVNKKIIDTVTKPYKNITLYMVTKHDFRTYNKNSAKTIYNESKIIIKNLKHDHFILEIPRGTYANKKYRILSEAEVKEIIETELCLKSKANLSKIKVYDPMVIWYGAKEGDVVEITGLTETTGKYINYRLVVNLPDMRTDASKTKTTDDSADVE